jgi:uncharacterized tellurite resistance protein B-like protein
MNILTAIKKLMRLSVISKELTSQESEQLKLAISILMIEMIRADFIELQKEKKIMHEVIMATMELSAADADKLIETAEVHSDFTISLQSHTAVINNFLSQDEKKTLIKNLWILANIDDELHKLEFNMLNKVAKHLGFNSAQLNQICELDN